MDNEPTPRIRLSRADEVALLRRIDAGTIAAEVLHRRITPLLEASEPELRRIVDEGERARSTLLDAHSGLVWYVVRPIAVRTGQPAEDLFQEGYVGLLEAVDRYLPERGNFATCALPWIRMRVRDAATTAQGALGLPPRRARQWRRTRSAVTALTGALARTPRVEEVAEATGETALVVRNLLSYTPVVPLDRDHPRWLRLCADPTHEPTLVDPDAVRRLLGRLDHFDRTVVVQLYGLDGPPRSHADLADATGRSESTIRRRERRALALMRGGDAAGRAA